MAKTMVMADNTTRAMDMEDTSRLTLKKDIIFEGKNDKYKISIKNYIGAGGESKVYLATRISDNEKVVAKIYDTFTDDPVKKRNRKNVINFLNENIDYEKSHIMPLLDEGMIFMESSDGDDEFHRPVDIIPYCKDGELKQCDYKMLKNKVIPEILIALKTLHESNLVHRDIKPDNIYIYNDKIVLADFGTTSQILNISDYGKTETKRGTPGYTAPEISDKYFIIESDYYSFGCTIASLYKGKHVYQTLIDQKKYVDINIAMRREGLPLSCPDKESDLQALVNALVMPDSAMRASYEGVNSWLKDSKSFVSSWSDKLNQGYESITTEFKFKDRICKNKNDLTEAMLDDWEYAKQLLYKGGEKNSAIINYYSKEEPNLSLKAINIIEEDKDTVNNQDLGLAKFLHYLNSTEEKPCPIYWIGKTYNSIEEIIKEVSSGKITEQNIIKMLQDKYLSWKFMNTNGVSANIITSIKEIEEITITDKCQQLGYYTFIYRFTLQEKKLKTNPDIIFKDLTRINENILKINVKSLSDDKMLAHLVDMGWKNNIIGFKKNCIGKFSLENGISDLLLFYQLFEGVCEDKKYVREHYLQNGPQANIYQNIKNIRLDIFVSMIAKERIKNLNINSNVSINDLYNNFMSFKQYLKDEEEEKNRLEQERKKRIEREFREEEYRKKQEEEERIRIEQQKRENKARTLRNIKNGFSWFVEHGIAWTLFLVSIITYSIVLNSASSPSVIPSFLNIIPLLILQFSRSFFLKLVFVVISIISVISMIAVTTGSGYGFIGFIAIISYLVSVIMITVKNWYKNDI